MTNSFSDGVNQFRLIGGPQRYPKTTGAVEAIEVRDHSGATLGHLWTGTDSVSARTVSTLIGHENQFN